MRYLVLGLLCGLLSVPASAAILEESFDDGIGGWLYPFKPDQAPTTQTAVAHKGGALETRYTLDGQPPVHALARPLQTGIARARSVRFWACTSRPSLVGVILNEKSGARYMTGFATEPGQWRHYEISLDRFQLTDDTTDPNGVLDLDQVDALGVADATMMFAPMMPRPPDPKLERKLWLDELVIDADEAPTSYSSEARLPYLLDTFDTDFLPWLALAGTARRDVEADQLVWQYGDEPPKSGITALIALLGPLPARGAKSLVLTLRSDQARTLGIVLQEAKSKDGARDESRYAKALQLPASDKPQTMVLPLTDFKLDETNGGKDENNKLDLDQVNTLLIADFGVMMRVSTGDNTIRIEELMLSAD